MAGPRMLALADGAGSAHIMLLVLGLVIVVIASVGYEKFAQGDRCNYTYCQTATLVDSVEYLSGIAIITLGIICSQGHTIPLERHAGSWSGYATNENLFY